MKYATALKDFEQVFEQEALNGKDLEDFYYSKTMPIRVDNENESPMDDIYNSCLLVKHQNTHLLLGHKGCGKSTELNVLKKRLEESGRKVSVIQYKLETDQMGVSYWDLLVLLGKHLCMIADDISCDLPDSLIKNITDFWKDKELTETIEKTGKRVTTVGASVNTPKFLHLLSFFAGLSRELQVGHTTREQIRETIKRRTAQWLDYITEVSDYITKHLEGKQPVIIFEDLDKLEPLDRAWDIFSNPLSQMPFPVIYTCPISLFYYPKFSELEASFNNNIQCLPMIKTHTLEGSTYQPGIEAITCIVEKRVDLALFAEGALLFLINKTGGVLRDLFVCISKAASRANSRGVEKIELEDAQIATQQLRSNRAPKIEFKNYPLLKNIYLEKKYKTQIEDRTMLLEMMHGLIVLEYKNGDRWRDLHPLIADFLIDQGEL